MPIYEVNRLPAGARLAAEVHTSLGGLLFLKGTLLEERDLEILEAFLVDQVEIEEDPMLFIKDEKKDEPLPESKEEPVAKRKETKIPDKYEFEQKFDKAIVSFRNMLKNIQSGQNIPVLEVREIISPLLQTVSEQPNLLLSLRRVSNVDTYTYEHSVAVGLLAYVIAKWMKMPEKEWMQIALAGILLDVGKTKIDPKILWKPGKLTPEEFEEMKKHTVYGYQLIKSAPGLSEGVAMAALQHHEREDGSGYPLGLKSNKIHIYSKIVAVADVYHAMCSNRVYREGTSPYMVVEQLIQDSFGKLDPAIVHTFVNAITQFSAGTVVELSDGSIGRIVFTDRNNPTRPMVEVNKKIINLAENRKIAIVKVM
ncbi:HD-GYP domain-containing protein [Brevibacillus dissolubilis]|uniref:HD-GYP domain-containing protein n=1 Tax=Brevibacillus dissolubilis TaxID=1844116 RepID=UPI001116DEC9|nr:HD-GYP domain-containing protein [Brevibacillus dissolubilis]